MTERGQRIYKWIVWIGIILAIVLTITYKVYVIANPKVTEAEWVDMISEEFALSNVDYIKKPVDENVTGEFVAITVMQAMGTNYLEGVAQKTNLSENDLINMALEGKIVDDADLNKEISSSEADEILARAKDYYFDPQNFPQYFNVEYSCDVVDASEWSFEEYDSEENLMYVSFEGNVPEPGEILIYKDSYGIAYAQYVSSCQLVEGNKYEIRLEDIENMSDVIETLSFSGTADFSYLLNQTEDGQSEPDVKLSEDSGLSGNNAYAMSYLSAPLLLCSIYPTRVLVMAGITEWIEDKTAVSGDWTTQGVDIELGGDVSFTNQNGKNSATLFGYIIIKAPDGTEEKYKVEVDEGGKITCETTLEDFAFEMKNEADASEDKFGEEVSLTNSFSYRVKLSDFSVMAAGYFQTLDWNDDKNYIDVRVSSDVRIEDTMSAKFEDKIPIAELSIPIAATGGIVSVNLKLYLTLSVSGDLTLVYELDDAYSGIRYASSEGVSTPHGHSYEKEEILAKIEFEGGLCGEAAVKAFRWDIVDPGINVTAKISAETLERNPGFEEYPNCVQTQIAFPLVSFEVSAGEDSVLGKILDARNVATKAKYDFITEDNAPVKLEYHYEEDLEGKITCFEGDKDVCTHVTEKEKDAIAEMQQSLTDEAQKKKEVAERKAQEALETAIEAAVEKWFEENCGGCY